MVVCAIARRKKVVKGVGQRMQHE